MKIIAEPSAAQPRVCRFVLETPVLPGKSISCVSRVMAQGSPLLEALFAIDGVRQVLVAENVVTVEKNADGPWADLAKKIGEALRRHLESGRPSFGGGEVAPEVEEHIRKEA